MCMCVYVHVCVYACVCKIVGGVELEGLCVGVGARMCGCECLSGRVFDSGAGCVQVL